MSLEKIILNTHQKMNNGGFQIISMNPETKFAESPALGYWKKFMEYKNFC